MPGTGTVEFAATMAALAAAGFQGDIVGEAFINMPSVLAKALSVWRPVAKSAEEVLYPGMTYLSTSPSSTVSLLPKSLPGMVPLDSTERRSAARLLARAKPWPPNPPPGARSATLPPIWC